MHIERHRAYVYVVSTYAGRKGKYIVVNVSDICMRRKVKPCSVQTSEEVRVVFYGLILLRSPINIQANESRMLVVHTF